MRSRPREEQSEGSEPERKRIKEGSVGTEPDESDAAAVETTVDLEFMVSRPRLFPGASLTPPLRRLSDVLVTCQQLISIHELHQGQKR